MLSELKVGPVVVAAGVTHPARSSRNGALCTADAVARYYEAVKNGGVFIGANPAGTAVTTQAGLSATTPALTLYNPVGSGVDLVLLAAQYLVTASPAAAAGFMLAYNLPTAAAPSSTTAVTPINALLGGAAGVGQCYRVATLAAAPVAFRYLGGVTGASAISGYPTIDAVDGQVIVPPGVAISIQATSAAAILAAFVWEEKPI